MAKRPSNDMLGAETQCVKQGRYQDYLTQTRYEQPESIVKQWLNRNNSLVCQCKLTFDGQKLRNIKAEMEDLQTQVEGVPWTSDVKEVACAVSHNLCYLSLIQMLNNITFQTSVLSSLQDMLEKQLKKVFDIDCEMTVAMETETLIYDLISQPHLTAASHLLFYDLALLHCLRTEGSQVKDLCSRRLQAKHILKRLKQLYKNTSTKHTQVNGSVHHLVCLPFNPVNPQLSTVLPGLINKLLCVVYLQTGEHKMCEELIGEIEREHGLSDDLVYLKAYIQYLDDRYTQCIQTLNNIVGNNNCQSHLVARSYNLIGCCFAKKGAPQSALQQFQMSLNSELDFILPLYNVSLQYRLTGQHDAELEALNLIVMALQEQTKTSDVQLNPDLLQCHLLNEPQLTQIQVLFLLARRCMELQRYDIAATKYLQLVDILKSGKAHIAGSQSQILSPSGTTQSVVSHDPELSIPELQQVYYEAASCLLSSGQHNRCIEICDILIDVLSGPWNKTQARYKESANQNEDDDLMSLLSEELFSSCENIKEEWRNPSSTDVLILCHVLLYKAESLANIGQLTEAKQALNSVIEDLTTETVHRLHHSNSLTTEAVHRLHHSNSAAFNQKIMDFLQTAYINMSVLLLSEANIQQALHYSRLALQTDTESTQCLYTHTVLLFKLHRCGEAATDWLKHRQISTEKSTRDLKNVLQEMIDAETKGHSDRSDSNSKLNELDKTQHCMQLNNSSKTGGLDREQYCQLDKCCIRYVLKDRGIN